MLDHKRSRLLWALWLTAAFAGAASAGSWPSWRRSEARTAYSDEEAAPPFVSSWTYAMGGQTVSSPVAAYGRVYIGARDNKLYCFAAAGGFLWSYTAGDWIDSTPLAAEGKVFFTSRDGYLYALDAVSRAFLWKYQTGSRDVGSPAYLNGEIYAVTGNPNNKLYVLNAATGALKRSAALTAFATSSPALDRLTGAVLLGQSDGKLGAFNLAMLPQWGSPVQTRGSFSFTTPALSGGKVLAAPGDDDWAAHAYDEAAGSEIWASTSLSNTASLASSISVSTDTVFLGSGFTPHTLYALRLNDGTIKWSRALANANNFGVASSPAVAGDVVYVVSPDGQLYGLTASTGGVAAKIALSSGSVSSPAVSNGWVYAATLGGMVYGFKAQNAWFISGPEPLLEDVSGVITVTGTVASAQLASYRLDYSNDQVSWTTLAQGTQPVSGALAQWDTRRLPSGLYTLRLSVQEKSPSGFRTEARVSIPVSRLKSLSVDPSASTTLSLGEGTEITIPAGALTAGDTLVAKVMTSGFPETGVSNFNLATPIVRQFKLASSAHPQFLKPVTIKIPYSDYVPFKEANMRMSYFDDSAGSWVSLDTSRVNTDEKRVVATVDHFTMFRLLELKPSDTLLTDALVYTYPNPATGNTVTFKFFAGNACDVSIRIYDVTGGLVGALQQPGIPPATVVTLDWDVSNKASGVYLYVVEANGPVGKSVVSKKLAIVH